MTEENKKPNLMRLAFIGVGLIAIGIVLALFLNHQRITSASFSNLSAVPAEKDYPAPSLDLLTLDGNPVSLADYRGSVVLVNLWATWCLPCREEMPILQSFYEEYKDKGFVLIGINQEETQEVVKPFVEKYDLNFPIWLDEDYLAQQKFHTVYLPSSYVIDRDGQVRLLWFGQISSENLEKFVPKIILE